MNEPPVPGLMLAAIIAAGFAAVLSWWFVARYSRVTWRRTREGRHVMRFTTLLAVTFTLTVVFALVPVSPMVRALVSLIAFGMIAAEIWTRIVLLQDAQREMADKEE